MKKYDFNSLETIKKALYKREKELFFPGACKSEAGIRRFENDVSSSDYRQSFSIDVDRILHSMAYTRYIDKTQVFSLIENNHITHRVLHVQLVSRISRSIGRFLGLNEDLLEAIALGHDIGHTPFGHDGERFLSELCEAGGIGFFRHSVQSVQFLDRVERNGKGWNLCLQTLDGILCHDGEIHNRMLQPEKDKSFNRLKKEIEDKKNIPGTQLVPMTLEGCLVRMADTVSYVGRDIEDAIRLGLIKRTDIPEEIADILGDTNGKIVFALVTDLIINSYEQKYISFGREISEALIALKQFNMERIYMNPRIKKHLGAIKRIFKYLFEQFLNDLKKRNLDSVIYTGFLKDMSDRYMEKHKDEEIVRDFVAGMTDNYFLRQSPEKMRPVADFL